MNREYVYTLLRAHTLISKTLYHPGRVSMVRHPDKATCRFPAQRALRALLWEGRFSCSPTDKEEDCTYRAGAGVPPNFRRFFARGGGLKVNASIVLRMNPLYLVSWFLERVKSALCPLNPDFFILRNCVQGFDHWVHSLAVPCRHLCDTYLGVRKKKKLNSELSPEI